ncbi:hypothetical protein [Hyalangium versicolor]|uniref:hypothetical protein n=1 Tax=Hyalangium versicolor TaxID=2861190 RepID=UPI001CCC875E|nr:hypothetical protein [Hyalangium versicolor]
MDPLEKALKELEAHTLEELLTRLAEQQTLRAKGEPVRLPRVTLHLRSGREVQGFLLEQREDRRGGKAVVLHALSHNGQRPEPDAIFVQPEVIEAITVHDLPSLAQLPKGGPPPPTRLELKRKLAARQASLAASLGTPLELEVDWDPLQSPEALSAIDSLGTRALEVLEGLARELMGLEALRTKVRKLNLSVGPATQVHLEEQSLRLVTTLSVLGWQSKEELQSAIEKVL